MIALNLGLLGAYDDENEEDASVKVEHVDCFDAFNTSQVFV